MKPCREYKEWIALAVLEGERCSELRQHLEGCVACRAYAEEMERVCGEHSQRAVALPEVEAPRRLNDRVRDAITRSEGSLCCGIEIGVSLRRWLMQAMGIAAAAAIIVVMLMQRSSREPTSPPAISETTTPGVSETTGLAEPTFAAYHHRLARSVEELEASLRDYGAGGGGEVLKASSAIDLP